MGDGVALVVEAAERLSDVCLDASELGGWILDYRDDAVLRCGVAAVDQLEPVTRSKVALDEFDLVEVGRRFGERSS